MFAGLEGRVGDVLKRYEFGASIGAIRGDQENAVGVEDAVGQSFGGKTSEL